MNTNMNEKQNITRNELVEEEVKQVAGGHENAAPEMGGAGTDNRFKPFPKDSKEKKIRFAEFNQDNG